VEPKETMKKRVVQKKKKRSRVGRGKKKKKKPKGGVEGPFQRSGGSLKEKQTKHLPRPKGMWRG